MIENDYRIEPPVQHIPTVAGMNRIDGDAVRKKREIGGKQSKEKKNVKKSSPEDQSPTDSNQNGSKFNKNGHSIDIRA